MDKSKVSNCLVKNNDKRKSSVTEKKVKKVKKEQLRDSVKCPKSVPTKPKKRKKQAFSIGNHKLASLRHVRNKPFINIRQYKSVECGQLFTKKKGIILNLDEWKALIQGSNMFDEQH